MGAGIKFARNVPRERDRRLLPIFRFWAQRCVFSSAPVSLKIYVVELLKIYVVSGFERAFWQ